MDLAGAYYREGRFEDSERHVEKALELGYPTPGLAHNYLACIASARRDMDGVQEHLRRALRVDPMHYTVARNAEALRVWLSEGGPVRGLPLELTARHDFQLFEKTRQPALPGPLPDHYAEWTDAVSAIGEQPLREADAVGSTATFKRRLSVV
jgi:tetratricopeptide (TPR) repeat protein